MRVASLNGKGTVDDQVSKSSANRRRTEPAVPTLPVLASAPERDCSSLSTTPDTVGILCLHYLSNLKCGSTILRRKHDYEFNQQLGLSPPTTMASTFLQTIETIISRHGANTYLGEPVSMQAHFLQCAEQVDQQHGDESLVVAALLHDIGHFSRYFKIDAAELDIDHAHGELGAQILTPFFGPKVVEPVRLHVPAKRYLCATETGYFEHLSPASVKSLVQQGGPMTKEETKAFEHNPWYEPALRVRRADDNAKVIGQRTRSFEDFRPLIEAQMTQPGETDSG